MSIDPSIRLCADDPKNEEKYPSSKKINTSDANHVKLNIYEAEMESKLENDIKSCCGSRFDKRVVFIFTKIALSMIIVLFSIYGMLTATTCEATNLYSGILSFVLGHWLR